MMKKSTSPTRARRATSHEHPPLEIVSPSPERLERAAELLRALADRQRLELLFALTEGERCVGELVVDDTNLSTVSQRLKTLRQAGLIERRREGKHIYYRLADTHVRDLIDNALLVTRPHPEESS